MEHFSAGFSILLFLIIWTITCYPMYYLYKKANLKTAWLAFVPISPFNTIPFFHAINKSAWHILLLFIPFVNIILAIIWTVQLLKAYNANPWFLLLSVIPLINIIFLLYFCFSSTTSYILMENRYQNDNVEL